mgnify:CR=1 FL=1
MKNFNRTPPCSPDRPPQYLPPRPVCIRCVGLHSKSCTSRTGVPFENKLYPAIPDSDYAECRIDSGLKKKIQGVTPPGPIYEYVGAVARDGIDSTTVGFLDLENRGSRWNFLPLCHETRDISGVCSV